MTGGAGWPRFTVAEIDTALLSLPERERAVLMAHRIRRMSNAEIAKACRTDVADVERTLAAALLHLKQAFDRLAEERGRDP
jgi:DNA-directed RNA polymerase specialized sigma24 family protein